MESIIFLIAVLKVVINIMGKEFIVNSFEDMCDLMCNNYIPEEDIEDEEEWVFTFGYDQEHAGHYVIFSGTYSEARNKMCEKYGNRWAFQYSKKEWDEMENDPYRMYDMETPLGGNMDVCEKLKDEKLKDKG